MANNNICEFPYDFKNISPEEQEEIDKNYKVRCRLLRVGPKGFIVYEPYKKEAANIYNMPLRPTDIFVATYQRLFQFIDLSQIDTVLEDVGADLDDHNLRNIFTMMGQPVTGLLASMSSPRFIKTHLPMSLLNPKLLDTAKLVYVARDPRDVAVSCYHHAKLFKMRQFLGGFKDFWNMFYKGLFTLCPIIEHVKEAWDLREHPNMLFLFYEELSKDLPASIRRVAKFLDKELNQEQMDRLCDHLSIENFKKNKSVNFEEMREYGLLSVDETFVRKGKTGGWRDYFDDEMTQQAEQWIKNSLRDTNLRYPHMDY